jgi:hypothetical protein
MADLEDYQHLGIDITVLPDLDEDEKLAEDIACLGQDLINMWTQPTGIADGTEDGAQYGVDIGAQLKRAHTLASLFALKVAMEVQAERDDRVDSCRVRLTLTPEGEMTIEAVVQTALGPYPFSFRVTQNNVGALYVERLG